jgi:exodeoxyribonuclease V gamma subunit
VVLRPVAEPESVVRTLLALYWEGLRRPLPFFPRAAHRACVATGDPLAAARATWERARTPQAPPGEGDDPYNELAFRGRDPFDAEFLAIAHRVFDPLLAHQDEDEP